MVEETNAAQSECRVSINEERKISIVLPRQERKATVQSRARIATSMYDIDITSR